MRILIIVTSLCMLAAPVPEAVADCGATCGTGGCVFDGIQNTPAGGATLSLDASCNLVVSNIGSSGLDGVVQENLASTYMVTTLATPNLSGSGLGTAVEILQIGVANSQGGRELSATRFVNFNGSDLRLSMDCAAIGATSYATEIYDDGSSVFLQAPVNDSPVLSFPKGDMVSMACGLLPNGDLYTTIRLAGPTPLTIQTASGSLGPFTGTCIKMRAFSPTDVPTQQEAIENYFKNVPAVALSKLFVGSLPLVDHVCPQAPVPVRHATWGAIKTLYR